MINKNILNIDVKNIKVTPKDIERVQGLTFCGSTFFGNGTPFRGETQKMAKTIKCPIKLIRRTKAILEEYGTQEYCGLSNQGQTKHFCNPYEIFKQALINMGFSYNQINNLN